MKQLIDTFTDNYGNPIFRIYISIQPKMKRQKRLHRHTEFEISLILSGKGVYSTTSGEYRFEKGDMFLFSTNEYHYITDIEYGDDKCFQILNIQFAPAFIYESGNSKDTLFMNIFLHRTTVFHNMLTRDNPYTEQIRQLFYSIKQECEEKKPCYRTETRNKVISILINIFRNYNYAESTISPSASYNIEGLQKAIAYINENYCYDISLDAIAAAAFLSKFHFMHLFKSTYNMTVWDYINIKRIDKALSLLANSNENVLTVAAKSGFNNSANFNRIFKKITGLTPKEYRQSTKS
ncbi:MAG: AraC family transcriptional regulator [Christensenellaceae bacterium]